MTESPPEVSIVVPCYNEEGSLRPLVEAIRDAMESQRIHYELLITDDGSTDRSWSTLQALAREEPRLRAQRFTFNCGQSAALWAGMRAARAPVIVTMDGDLQNPPRDILKLLEGLKQYDCACGTRVEARAQGDSWLRIASSRIANWVRNKLSGETISDAGCCFRAFRRECIEPIKFYKGMHRFLPTLLKMEGFTVVEVPVSHDPRVAGQSHYGVWNRLFKSFADLLAVRWMKKRVIRYEIVETVNASSRPPGSTGAT